VRIAQFHLFNALSIMRTLFFLLAFTLSTAFLSGQIIIIGPSGGGGGGTPTYQQGYDVGCGLAMEHVQEGTPWNQVFFGTTIVYNTYNDARIRGWAMYALGVLEGFQTCYRRPTQVGGINGGGCNEAWGVPCPPSGPIGGGN
jgi:hypothetical protein